MRSLVALATLLALACRSDTSAPAEQLGGDAESYWPAASWRAASPAQLGVKASAIAGLTERLRAGSLGVEHSLVIVRKGYLIADEYFAGWTADSIHTEQSVTKSVTSLVAGIAIARGDLRGVDQPLVELFARYAPIANLDDRKRALTVRDVLTMRTGMAWNEDSCGRSASLVTSGFGAIPISCRTPVADCTCAPATSPGWATSCSGEEGGTGRRSCRRHGLRSPLDRSSRRRTGWAAGHRAIRPRRSDQRPHHERLRSGARHAVWDDSSSHALELPCLENHDPGSARFAGSRARDDS